MKPVDNCSVTEPPKIHSSEIEFLPIEALKLDPRNPRTHSRNQRRLIKKSIEKFGFTNPVLIGANNEVLAGHGRIEVANELGMATVPCRRLAEMSEEEKRAYLIADNKLALGAGWDRDLLALHFGELGAVGFDVSLTGFEMGEIDILMKEVEAADTASTADNDDESPQPDREAPAVVRPGDIIICGRHLIMCGNAREENDVRALMRDKRATAVFIDPPYNVPIQGHVSGLGKIRHREFAEASGDLSPEQFTTFLKQALGQIAALCHDGAIVYVCMDWRHMVELLEAGYAVFTELKNLCTWVKSNAGMGTFYRSQHELIFVWKHGTAPHINNFGLGEKGRHRSNVWKYAGVNSFGSDRMEELQMHSTVKPVQMVADAIMDVTHRGDVVLDTFAGSGTTLIAAERTGRVARVMEIDAHYCDVIVERWEKTTGKAAIFEATGLSFENTRIIRNGWTSGTAREVVA